MRQHKSFSPPQADSGAPSVSAHRRQQASASTSAALLLLSFLMFAPASHAEWSGELRFLSEHIHRGYSSSRGDPSVQAELRYLDASGWVAGASISRVAFDDEDGDALAEVRPSIAYSQALDEDWRTEFGLTAYLYSGDVFKRQSAYAEAHASIHYRRWFSATAFLAPNAYGRKADVPSAEITLRQDLSDSLQLSGGAGYTRASRLLEQDYPYWNLGVSWFPASRIALDLRYLDAGIHTHQGEIYGPSEFYPRVQDHRYQISLTIGF